jgi:hypothetical protein
MVCLSALARLRTAVSLTLAFAGCAPTLYPLYEGPRRPVAEVARVCVLSGYVESVDSIDAVYVDGHIQQFTGGRPPQRGSWFGNEMLELLPGSHVVRVGWSSDEDGVVERYSEVFTILVEAGHQYELRGYPPNYEPRGYPPRAYPPKIVEVGPGKKCREF